jgi:predicted nucleic acid-binding protein
MKPVFLDTGYLIALEAGDDQNHAAARPGTGACL